jgi:predicted phosphodiesterase
VRIAALYDIHGNLPALDAVLGEVERAGVDRVVIGGDVVPGPLPVETIERVRTLGDRAVFVRGNGDRWVVDAFDALGSRTGEDEKPGRPWVAWTAAAIDRRDRDLLASFADRVVLDVDGLGATLFCHGSPRDDEEVLTALTPERRWRPALEGVAEVAQPLAGGVGEVEQDRACKPSTMTNPPAYPEVVGRAGRRRPFRRVCRGAVAPGRTGRRRSPLGHGRGPAAWRAGA